LNITTNKYFGNEINFDTNQQHNNTYLSFLFIRIISLLSIPLLISLGEIVSLMLELEQQQQQLITTIIISKNNLIVNNSITGRTLEKEGS
jgi:hypothetical protein